MKLTFYGGVHLVSGANYLLESDKIKILIDCGLFQGGRFCEEMNFQNFPYQPKEIDAVFITHAHIDHIGRLPKLVKAGFRGRIFSTPPTRDFAELMLLDSEHLLAQEAEEEKKAPIYNVKDVAETMVLWKAVPYHQPIHLGDLVVEFFDAGHILGSASILVTASPSIGGQKIAFSGDLGNTPAPLIKPTEFLPAADYVLMESTYGNKIHENLEKRKDLLEDLIEETVKTKGVLMIPAFALERTQELLFELNELVENGRVPQVPVFIDSPLAIKLTAVYQKYSGQADYFNENSIELVRKGDAIFNFAGLKTTLTTEQSKEINSVPPPKVIIAGAGMSNGGRILHHESRYLADPNNAILFIGYQANGSLGRQILDGAEKVKIFGQEIPVRCKVRNIDGYSAHADQNQLLQWLQPLRLGLKKVFVVQGEDEQAEPLVLKIRDELAIEAEIPSLNQTVVI